MQVHGPRALACTGLTASMKEIQQDAQVVALALQRRHRASIVNWRQSSVI